MGKNGGKDVGKDLAQKVVKGGVRVERQVQTPRLAKHLAAFPAGCFSLRRQSGGWRLIVTPLIVLIGLLGWNLLGNSTAQNATWLSERELAEKYGKPGSTNANKSGKPAGLNGLDAVSSDANKADLASTENPNDPRAQLALWTKRLARAQFALDSYRGLTRYPHESRPAAEHGDQMYPNQPIVEEKRLYRPGSNAANEAPGAIRLRTSQERIFVAGSEGVLFTIAAVDEGGNIVPLATVNAGIVDPPQSGKPSSRKRLAVAFNDAGADGDGVANDGTYSFRFTPAKQGFANFAGQLRLDMTVTVATQEGQPLQTGFTYFDMYYTPEPPAVWTGGKREAIVNGSLFVYLQIDVRLPGRYIISGRFDDATGKPFAFSVFNEELSIGKQEIPLRLFGKLILDHQPVIPSQPPSQPASSLHSSLPFRLRDVDGFLLMEDSSPDRALMSRLVGPVHSTKSYNLALFSDAEWQSEERERYLREYLSDVNIAKSKIDELNKLINPPAKG